MKKEQRIEESIMDILNENLQLDMRNPVRAKRIVVNEIIALLDECRITSHRKQLKDFNSWMCGKQYDGRIPMIDTCIDEYIESKKTK